MRTQEEIIGRIKEKLPADFFGFQTQDLLLALMKENILEHGKALGLDIDDPKEFDDFEPQFRDDESVRGRIRSYMSFAFDKAVNHRGISAERSIAHYRSWLWLIGDEELLAFAEDDNNYMNYGAPILKKIAERYMIELPKSNVFECMARGEECPECREGHSSGCGR